MQNPEAVYLIVGLAIVVFPAVFFLIRIIPRNRKKNQATLEAFASRHGLTASTVDGVTTVEGVFEGISFRITNQVWSGAGLGETAGNKCRVEFRWPVPLGANLVIRPAKQAQWEAERQAMGIQQCSSGDADFDAVVYVAGDPSQVAPLFKPAAKAAVRAWVEDRAQWSMVTDGQTLGDQWSGRVRSPEAIEARVRRLVAVVHALG